MEQEFKPKKVLITSSFLRNAHGFEVNTQYETVPTNDSRLDDHDCVESLKIYEHTKSDGGVKERRKAIIPLYSHEYKVIE